MPMLNAARQSLLMVGALVVGLTGCPVQSNSSENAEVIPVEPTQTEDSASPAAAPPNPSEAALPPGRYCYGIDSETLTGAVRLAIADSLAVTGDSSFTIHSEEAGYYSSYAQKLEGLLYDNQISMDITTWIEYDQQTSQEVWTISPDTLSTERETLQAVDCEVARERFVGPDGLEAADLLEGAANIHTRRVEFAPGKTATTVEGSVVRGDRDMYLLNAQGGQQMTLAIAATEDNAVFDVIDPSGYVLARESTNEDIPLPHTGDYQVVVGGTRGNATYELEIEIR